MSYGQIQILLAPTASLCSATQCSFWVRLFVLQEINFGWSSTAVLWWRQLLRFATELKLRRHCISLQRPVRISSLLEHVRFSCSYCLHWHGIWLYIYIYTYCRCIYIYIYCILYVYVYCMCIYIYCILYVYVYCMCVYIYICDVYWCMYVFMYVCMYICMYVYIYMHCCPYIKNLVQDPPLPDSSLSRLLLLALQSFSRQFQVPMGKSSTEIDMDQPEVPFGFLRICRKRGSSDICFNGISCKVVPPQAINGL